MTGLRLLAAGINTASGLIVLKTLKDYCNEEPEPVSAVSQILGGIRDAVGGITLSSKLGIVVGGTITAATGTFLYMRRKKIKTSCSEYVTQLKEKIGIEITTVPNEKMQRYVGESLRAGSMELKTNRPKCQILVGNIENGNFVIYGSAVRIWNSVVVPTHVVDSADLDGKLWMKGAQGCLSLTTADFYRLDTDISGIDLTDNQLSQIGAPQANLYETISDKGEFVSVAGVQGMGTVGNLRHDSTAFGKVCYLSTTMPGYSGAPYMKGDRVAGIHGWGGATNGGYSASYIKARLDGHHKRRLESSEDFLMKIFKSKTFRSGDINMLHGDEVYVRYNGQYHLVDGDTFRKARGLEYIDGTYDDAESMEPESLRHSGESNSLTMPGASGNSNQPGDLESLVSKALINELQSLSKKQFRDLKQNSASNPLPSTSGLLSTPKQK